MRPELPASSSKINQRSRQQPLFDRRSFRELGLGIDWSRQYPPCERDQTLSETSAAAADVLTAIRGEAPARRPDGRPGRPLRTGGGANFGRGEGMVSVLIEQGNDGKTANRPSVDFVASNVAATSQSIQHVNYQGKYSGTGNFERVTGNFINDCGAARLRMAMFLLWNARPIHMDLLCPPQQHDARKFVAGPARTRKQGEAFVAQKICLQDRHYRGAVADVRTYRSCPVDSLAGPGRHAQERAACLGRQS